MESPRIPDQSWEEVGGTGLHDDSTSRKDKSDLGLGIRNSNTRGQAHCDADPDCGALDSRNGGLGAAMDSQRYPSTSVKIVSMGR